MDFFTKLSRLTELSNKSAICRRASLPPGAISQILRVRYIPGGDVILNLARVLAVDPGWLIDDRRGWPPERTEGQEGIESSQLVSAA